VQFGNHEAGPDPTAERLTRSYWLHVPPYGLTDVEASFVSGTVLGRLNAFADYHRLARRELHVRTVAALRQLGMDLATQPDLSDGLRNLIRSMLYPEAPKAPSRGRVDSDRDYVGSQVSANLARLSQFFEQVRLAFNTYRDHLAVHRPEDRFPLLIKLFNLVSVQLYVLQEFALGVRPRGNVAILSYSAPGYGAWVEDKGSAKYREFSLSALPQILVEQEQQCYEALEALKRFGEQYHVQFVDERRRHTQQMAAHLTYRPSRGKNPATLTVETMTARDYEQRLRDAGLSRFCPIRRNELRHATVSHFRDLPAAGLTQYTGHHLPGLDMFAPWSSASAQSYFLLMREIAQFLNALSPTLLTIKEVV